jgi:hypothetical protein
VSGPTAGESSEHGALRWAVRSSFRSYVAALPDGEEQVSRGAALSDDGRIVFPPQPAISSPGSGLSLYAFVGTITYSGHAGALAVELSDPQVHVVAGGRSTVSVAPGSGRTGERPVIAAFVEWEIVDRRLIAPAPRLTWSGVAMLGDVYEVGDFLDPIEIELDRP